MQLRAFVIFITMLSTIWVVFGGFVAFFLGWVLNLSVAETSAIGAALIAAVLAYIPSEIYSRKTGQFWVRRLASLILGVFSILISATAVGYVALAIGMDSKWLAAAVLGSTALLAIWAIVNNHQRPVVTSLGLHFPHRFAPVRIVQLTDIHLNGIKSPEWVQRIVDQVNQLKPDIIVFTGDLIDVTRSAIQPHIDILNTLQAPHKLAISGNHDFYTGYDEFKFILDAIGFDLIDNRLVQIGDIQFVGVPDVESKRFMGMKSIIGQVMEARNPALLTIVLDHRPDHFRRNVGLGANLQLSGHTHWGQLPPFGILVRLRYRYAAGLKHFRESWIYTSRGTGTWGPPMRLFTRSEVVVLDLAPTT